MSYEREYGDDFRDQDELQRQMRGRPPQPQAAPPMAAPLPPVARTQPVGRPSRFERFLQPDPPATAGPVGPSRPPVNGARPPGSQTPNGFTMPRGATPQDIEATRNQVRDSFYRNGQGQAWEYHNTPVNAQGQTQGGIDLLARRPNGPTPEEMAQLREAMNRHKPTNASIQADWERTRDSFYANGMGREWEEQQKRNIAATGYGSPDEYFNSQEYADSQAADKAFREKWGLSADAQIDMRPHGYEGPPTVNGVPVGTAAGGGSAAGGGLYGKYGNVDIPELKDLAWGDTSQLEGFNTNDWGKADVRGNHTLKNSIGKLMTGINVKEAGAAKKLVDAAKAKGITPEAFVVEHPNGDLIDWDGPGGNPPLDVIRGATADGQGEAWQWPTEGGGEAAGGPGGGLGAIDVNRLMSGDLGGINGEIDDLINSEDSMTQQLIQQILRGEVPA